MKNSTYPWAFAAAIAAGVSGCSTFHHEDKNVPWDSVPAVVQSTVQTHLYGGTVSTVEREQCERHVVYEVKVSGADGWHSEVKVAEDGKLLKYKTKKFEGI